MNQQRVAGQKMVLFLAALAGLFFFYQPALAAQFNVSIGDNYYSPFAPMVAPGDTVVWTNSGSASHTVTADDGSFDSGTLAPGATYSHTFNQLGVANYYSKLDSTPASQGGNQMNAVILVNGSAPAAITGNQTSTTSTSTVVQYNPTSGGAQYTAPVTTTSSTPAGLQMDSGSTPNYVSDAPRFPSGSLVNDNGTIYLIRGGSKIPFTNYQAFIGLGYSSKKILTGNVESYPFTGYAITSAKNTHPWGSWLLYKGTIYYNGKDGLIGVPGYDIFTADGGKDSLVLPANAADIQVLLNNPNLPILQFNDSRLF
jgi:plastocyanin